MNGRPGLACKMVSKLKDMPFHRVNSPFCEHDFIGPANIQCRVVDGVPYAFEVNPRFSGTTYFRTLLGVNEPLNVIKNSMGLEVPTDLRLRPGKVRRYFSECLET